LEVRVRIRIWIWIRVRTGGFLWASWFFNLEACKNYW
jgi:hypothetical protein